MIREIRRINKNREIGPGDRRKSLSAMKLIYNQEVEDSG